MIANTTLSSNTGNPLTEVVIVIANTTLSSTTGKFSYNTIQYNTIVLY